ncbi:threonine aldolase family protein [Streptomyces griseoviridis]|uniref:Aminotransferase class I/II-fold pyridoxal phosphate-dependent enzyme n=1 Tax=Streptomyces griseoviridis TaxID=45398 RepID=A0A3S9ZMR9_STRGD|nr:MULTISPECIES: GntG family PLP-dependent aldolase [Streptomyces]AZS89054.1 aminotransferase class I/II-fold pyridoxal phosphate-dependent enzyme [Streptomyces griseoviridis]MDH6697734.1 threonine aldolase [Streptomyces sp. MAA16]QCN84099.1 threonine aldolase [Streptomyces griseoviridis]
MAPPPAGPQVDLRSDTVTRPDARMRRAMADAEVGDDVLDGDPTMRALEEEVAGLLGAEDALWVPSGSMGNLIALCVRLERGDRFLAPDQAHVLEQEVGTAAWLAGGMPRALPWTAGPGRPSPADVTGAVARGGPYFALRDRLLCLENTHNAAGGTVTSPSEHRELVAAAHAAGLLVHLDGARLWNAAVALGVRVAELAEGADSVQVCLSKGLGAPVGSVLAGGAAFVREGRRVRKMLGGGVRQGGILAAAGLVALGRVDRLAEDHEHARLLAAGLAERGWKTDVPQTNIVLLPVDDPPRTVELLAGYGIRTVPTGDAVRMITHCDVTREDVLRVVDAFPAPV